MIIIAFTLGFLGSLHCVGMCGPLALGVSNVPTIGVLGKLFHALKYNFGRVVTYSILGLVFGLIGQTLIVTGLQKFLSIGAGVLLVILFFASLDLETFFRRIPAFKNYVKKVSELTTSFMRNNASSNPFILGMANGLLPCGLVYLALTGSMLAGGIVPGILFMAFFGIATIPSLLILVLGTNLINMKLRLSLNRILPYVQLVMGVYLIYRGIAIDTPESLDFYSALKDPIMCH